MKTFFNIALSGLSEADARQVLETLESPKLGQWSLTEGQVSDLVIIDVDSVWGHMDWLRAVASERTCVALTEQEAMRDCDLLLKKPLETSQLTDMLLTVQEGRTPTTKASEPTPEPKPVESTPDAVTSSPKAAKAARISKAAQSAAHNATTAAPDKAAKDKPTPAPTAAPATAPTPAPVSGTVRDALLDGTLGKSIMVEGPDNVRLVIDPASSSYHAPPQLKPLEALLNLPASSMKPVANDDASVQHAGPKQPLVRLLWFAALCASDGTLAPHLDSNATWHLTRWPQIEREFPRHFRIATAMMKQAGTLADIAAAAKSPEADVAGFINAYFVAGYVAPEGSDEPVESANSTSKVLARLRRSFNRGITTAS